MGRKAIDLSGQNINGVIVCGMVDEKGAAGKHKRWQCICPVCKNEFIVASQHLRDKNKRTSMCGNCSRKQFNDLSGKKFGRLTVLSRDYASKSKRIKYNCVCECGSLVSVQDNHLTTGKIQSCGCIMSHGEEKIATWLSKHEIEFEKQKKFEGCKSQITLRFDFFIPKINTVIEYQGIQHFEPIDFFGGEIEFQGYLKRDAIKKEYCLKHNINYCTISYKENIEEALNKILSNEDIVWPHGNMAG